MAEGKSSKSAAPSTKFNIIAPGFQPPHGLDWGDWKRQYDVDYFVVCAESIEDGKRIINKSLSQYFGSRGLAERALDVIKTRHPDAFLGGGTRFFSPALPSDVLDRDAFIACLQLEVHHG